MKKFINLALSLLFLISLSACGDKNKTVNVVKDGKEFVYENIDFLYPSKFQVINPSDKTRSVQYNVDKVFSFENDDEVIEFQVSQIIENNRIEELFQLFRVEIESNKYTVVSNAKVTLENKDSCYELVVQNEKYKEKYLVIFEDGYRYSLMYRALISEYEDNIINMDKFLYTFTVKENGE